MSNSIEPAQPDWYLADAERRHADAPNTFEIPSIIERQRLESGDYVKLLFESPGECGERMWVQVTTPLVDGAYRGTIANDPVIVTVLSYEDEISFEPRHILSVQPPA